VTGGRVVVLGGSSPFAASLLDAFAEAASDLPSLELVLFGRSSANVDLLARFGRHRLAPLGWSVLGTTDLSRALHGARIVVHQARYGGLEARREAERLCARFGQIADETLGPAALRTGLLMRPQLERTVAALSAECPDAWVLNLVNPLGWVTGFVAERIERCVGLCELPRHTAALAAGICGLRPDEITWDYAGLNHRGFLYRVRHGDRDLIGDLAQRLGGSTVNGFAASDITALGAIPLKYFSLVRGAMRPALGRADFLIDLRSRILAELRSSVEHLPLALVDRDQPWYPDAVVPALRALLGNEPAELVVNVVAEDGLVEEMKVVIGADGMRASARAEPPHPVSHWIERFHSHERAVFAALRQPTEARIAAALRLDPMVPAGPIDDLARALLLEVPRCAA
jgi:6-phospho-beta-glucosidase